MFLKKGIKNSNKLEIKRSLNSVFFNLFYDLFCGKTDSNKRRLKSFFLLKRHFQFSEDPLFMKNPDIREMPCSTCTVHMYVHASCVCVCTCTAVCMYVLYMYYDYSHASWHRRLSSDASHGSSTVYAGTTN